MAKGLKKITRAIDIKPGLALFSNDRLSYGVGADKQVKLLIMEYAPENIY